MTDTAAAIVTGAGTGLGRAISLDLARRGVSVVLAGRTEGRLHDVATEIRDLGGQAHVVKADVSDASSVSNLFASTVTTFGGFGTLINNAGIAPQTNLDDLDEDEWAQVYDINVRGTFLCSREAARHFKNTKQGRAINIASVFGLLGRPGFTAYCSSKGAIINFTRSAAAEWARFGAQMNCVAPGYFATEINQELRHDDKATAKVLRRIPAHRMGEPGELANLVAYLALDAPDFLTGQTIAIDGGESSV